MQVRPGAQHTTCPLVDVSYLCAHQLVLADSLSPFWEAFGFKALDSRVLNLASTSDT